MTSLTAWLYPPALSVSARARRASPTSKRATSAAESPLPRSKPNDSKEREAAKAAWRRARRAAAERQRCVGARPAGRPSEDARDRGRWTRTDSAAARRTWASWLGDCEDLVGHDRRRRRAGRRAGAGASRCWNPVTYRCAFCGESFVSRAMIRRHLERHSPRDAAGTATPYRRAARRPGRLGRRAARASPRASCDRRASRLPAVGVDRVRLRPSSYRSAPWQSLTTIAGKSFDARAGRSPRRRARGRRSPRCRRCAARAARRRRRWRRSTRPARRRMACLTSGVRRPLPIMPFRPCLMSSGA